MNDFDSLVYRIATKFDCDTLATFINSCYRGELAAQGWTSENDFIAAPRTDAAELLQMIDHSHYAVLLFFGENDQVLKGSINVFNKFREKTAHLSLFCVRPDLQDRGYGKFILSTAEDYATKKWNVEHFELEVLIQSSGLVSFYNRRGYIDTGQHRPFTSKDLRFGYVLQDDLIVCIMRKSSKTKK